MENEIDKSRFRVQLKQNKEGYGNHNLLKIYSGQIRYGYDDESDLRCFLLEPNGSEQNCWKLYYATNTEVREIPNSKNGGTYLLATREKDTAEQKVPVLGYANLVTESGTDENGLQTQLVFLNFEINYKNKNGERKKLAHKIEIIKEASDKEFKKEGDPLTFVSAKWKPPLNLTKDKYAVDISKVDNDLADTDLVEM